MCNMTSDLSCSSSFPLPDTSTWVQFSTSLFFHPRGYHFVCFMYGSVRKQMGLFTHSEGSRLLECVQVAVTPLCNCSVYLFYDASKSNQYCLKDWMMSITFHVQVVKKDIMQSVRSQGVDWDQSESATKTLHMNVSVNLNKSQQLLCFSGFISCGSLS